MGRSHDSPQPAPKRVRALAGAIDAGLLVLAGGALLARRWHEFGGERGRRQLTDGLNGHRPRTVLSIVGPLGKVLAEQLGSPGQRIVGLRTVDRRTGRRIALWRTLLLSGLEVGSQLLSRRLTASGRSAESSVQGERLGARLRSLVAEHENDPAGYARAAGQLYDKQRVDVPIWRFVITASVAIGLGRVRHLLRARLAPRQVVLTPRRGDQRP